MRTAARESVGINKDESFVVRRNAAAVLSQLSFHNALPSFGANEKAVRSVIHRT